MSGIRVTAGDWPLHRRGVRLKLHENLGVAVADRIRAAGHDVATVYDEGLSGAEDDLVLAEAVAEGRSLVTMDLDFADPFRFDPGDTAGIAVLRVKDRPGGMDIQVVVDRLLESFARAELSGHLWIVDERRVHQYEEPSPGDGSEESKEL